MDIWKINPVFELGIGLKNMQRKRLFAFVKVWWFHAQGRSQKDF